MPTPDLISDQEAPSGWKAILGFALGLGVVLVAVFAGDGYERSGRSLSIPRVEQFGLTEFVIKRLLPSH